MQPLPILAKVWSATWLFSMVEAVNLYLDDTGNRRLDHKPNYQPPPFDFFGLGGVLINEEDEGAARELHATFCAGWSIDYPLHSCSIRSRSKRFSWLRDLSEGDLERFHTSLEELILACPIICIAAVIDRPGYNARYAAKYAGERWRLCKTAFTILVERSARVAIERRRKLRVCPEKTGLKEDGYLQGYYNDLKATGMPFDDNNSSIYKPLSADEFAHALYEFRLKEKSSPLSQIADLALYPMARGGYEPDYRPYRRLREAGKLIDCGLSPDEVPRRGIKYSCFDTAS
jgi:hypothetical protein